MRYRGAPRSESSGCPRCGGRVVPDPRPEAIRLVRDGAGDSHAVRIPGTCARCGKGVERVARVRAFSEWREVREDGTDRQQAS